MTTVKKTRAATRYPYLVDATCSLIDSEDQFNINLQNISSSGVQIKTDQKLEEGEKVQVLWHDLVQGKVKGLFYITRAVNQDQDDGYQYYGLRYYKLSDKYKKNVLLILNGLKNQDKQDSTNLGVQDAFDMVRNAKVHILKHLNNKQTDIPLMTNKINLFKPYEKQAFLNEVSLFDNVIVSYAVSHFQCLVLGDLVHQAQSDQAFASDFLEVVNTYVEETEKVEAKEESVFAYLKKTKDDGQLRLRYNESSNRLFYAKQGLFDKIIKEIPVRQLPKADQKNYAFISDRYDPSIGPEETIVDWQPSREMRVTPETFKKASQQKNPTPSRPINRKTKKTKKSKKKKIKNFRNQIGFLGWVLRFLILGVIGMLSYYVFFM